jgi:hypothetical protein
MIVSIFREIDGCIYLRDGGCQGSLFLVNSAHIIEAIEEHRKFIQELEDLLKEVECQPLQP